MPSCAVAMKRSCRTGSSRTSRTRLASSSPAAARFSIATRGVPTMANSAATNRPLSSTSTATTMISVVMRGTSWRAEP